MKAGFLIVQSFLVKNNSLFQQADNFFLVAFFG